MNILKTDMTQEQIQIQIQHQEQALKLTQNVTQQQLLQAQLVELPVNQLVERINAEMDDNPALEMMIGDETSDWKEHNDTADDEEHDNDYIVENEREEWQSALDEALASLGRDDEELPVYHGGRSIQDESEQTVYGDTVSFYDYLKEQLGELELTEKEARIMEYLIGSLDDDGLLRKSLDSVSDELAVYHNIETTHEELERLLRLLQGFDPAGIGARSLQECLLLQIRRKEPSRHTKLMETVVNRYFDEFTKKSWNKIQHNLKLSDLQTEELIGELRKLNPKPGASMGETVGRSLQQITPDFIVETHEDGTVTFHLNHGEVPELQVSQSFADMLCEYQKNREHMTRQMKEALLYTKKKVEAAQGFIEAIRVRQHTLTVTMRAIIQIQHNFFVDGDEASLRPMRLADVSERTGLDLSTISRVSNSKYAQTRWGTFPLRFFFSDGYVTETGEELSTRKIKAALSDIVEGEDKGCPLSDDAIRERLAEQGYPIARRTVAKYREQLDIPVARLRKEHI